MESSQLALRTKCLAALNSNECTTDALLGLCVVSLENGLRQHAEKFSVCIEEDRGDVTALGDQGTYYMLSVFANQSLMAQRCLPPCTAWFSLKMTRGCMARASVGSLSAAVCELYCMPMDASACVQASLE